MSTHLSQRPRQPFLNDALVMIAAPSQVWSRESGNMSLPIDGVYHGDVRHLGSLTLSCEQSGIEWIGASASVINDDGVTRGTLFNGLLRDADNDEADPKLRLRRLRTVRAGYLEERYEVTSRLNEDVELTLSAKMTVDFTPMAQIRDGRLSEQAAAVRVEGDAVVAEGEDDVRSSLRFPGGAVVAQGRNVRSSWRVRVPASGTVTVGWSARMEDPRLVVAPPVSAWATDAVGTCGDPETRRWVTQAVQDLDALRLTLPGSTDEFFAAGAPWYFTLFGRDSLWAARLLLPESREMAISTLRVLAGMQGKIRDVSTAEEPGKILHELRAGSLELPAGGMVLPPIYFGSVDSTLLWILLLADAWRAGADPDEVRALIPALRGALHWMTEYADGDGDGFLDYIDESGHGLSNQGWKDSDDSVQWRDGTIAAGPIALCEVQAYAYEAAIAGAELLEWCADSTGGLGADITPDFLRGWASRLKTRFHESFWVRTEEGYYPAIALDGHKRAVDTLTSNIGHLLGTGILDAEQESGIVDLLMGPSMRTGFGIRTMSSGAAGYWPLSYHGGSVWAHDSAIIAWGMERAGLHGEARELAAELAQAAASFGYRMPELHSGDSAAEVARPAPYPASCRPQAWAASAAIACAHIAGA
ncbi:MAG: glycogen debranching N-terminal domain-containing protein [Ancrocorticia sp.]